MFPHYYSLSELWQLTVMNYLQEIGLDFKVCCQILNQLREGEPELIQDPLSTSAKRFMLSQEEVILTDFDAEEAQKAVQRGESVLSFWTERINQRLLEGLNMVLLPKKKPLLLMTK